MLRRLYGLGLGLLALGYLPVFLVRKVWRAGYPLALGERAGFVPCRPGPDRIWVHAVSVGEVVAAVPLVRALRVRWPDRELVVSTVTGTGAAVARTRLPEAALVFTCPLDFAGATRRAAARIRPRALIVIETELWPNLLRAVAATGRPVVLVNGRISDRSFRRYRRVRRLFAPVLEDVSRFVMQSGEDARRIVAIGARPERVVVAGNLKMEAIRIDPGAGVRWRRLLRLGQDPVWVAGSTHRGEEEAILDAFVGARRATAGLRLALAPRHPERVDEVEALVRGRGLAATRRSRSEGASGTAPPEVILLDTVGELATLYAAADLVFVGGSLVPVGGHNVIEPAICGKAVVFGPHMTNFREAAALLLGAGGAVQVADSRELGQAVAALLADEPRRRQLGEAARRALAAHEGACARTLAALEPILAGDPGRGRGC